MPTLWLPGDPLAKLRPRFCRRGDGVGTYNPQKWEQRLTQFEMKKTFIEPTDRPTKVSMSFYMPVPMSYTRRKTHGALWGTYKHSCRPDIDNLAKYYLDAGNGVLWADDGLITSLFVRKFYSCKPGVRITVEDDIAELDPIAADILSVFTPEDCAQLADWGAEIGYLQDLIAAAEHCKQTDMIAAKQQIAQILSQTGHRFAKVLASIGRAYPDYRAPLPLPEIDHG